MKRLALWLALAVAPLLRAGDAAADLEKEIAALVAQPDITVVHFWAPWCPNCKAEMAPDGWARFVAANPGVKFVFLAIWHKGQDPKPRLEAAGLGVQPNLVLRTHPNPSRLAADRLTAFLGLPITWLPSTWIFREGRLCAAFNYGEIRFSVLQQMVDDSRNEWDR